MSFVNVFFFFFNFVNIFEKSVEVKITFFCSVKLFSEKLENSNEYDLLNADKHVESKDAGTLSLLAGNI